MKAVLREMFIAISALIMKLEGSLTSYLISHMKTLEQKEANTSERSRWQKKNQMRAAIKNRKEQRISEIQSWSFEKMNKIDKPLSKLTKLQKENMQINKTRDKFGDITTVS